MDTIALKTFELGPMQIICPGSRANLTCRFSIKKSVIKLTIGGAKCLAISSFSCRCVSCKQFSTDNMLMHSSTLEELPYRPVDVHAVHGFKTIWKENLTISQRCCLSPFAYFVLTFQTKLPIKWNHFYDINWTRFGYRRLRKVNQRSDVLQKQLTCTHHCCRPNVSVMNINF